MKERSNRPVRTPGGLRLRGPTGQFVAATAKRTPKPNARSLDRAIVAGVAKDMLEHGEAAAAAAREKDPLGYLRFGHTLVQEHKSSKPAKQPRTPVEQLSDEELEARIAYTEKEIEALTRGSEYVDYGEGEAPEEEATEPVPPLSETS